MKSRQQLWQERQKASGRCMICGKKRGSNKQYCQLCAGKANERAKKYLKAVRLDPDPYLDTTDDERTVYTVK